MFRLVKLAAYALLGYVLYELVMGISEGQADQGGGAESTQRSGGQSRARSGGGARGGGAGRGRSGGGRRGQTISGSGEGQSVPVSDSTGAEHTERVGRGVVSR